MRTIAIFAVRFVAAFFRTFGGRACRFEPSCSRYAEEAYKKFGFLKATQISFGRLLRCHPFSSGGWDPLIPQPTRKD
ncbi:MAG TPA: membrane protein insertion efficiency factor YidD [Candidatus Omnitrophota bacterium]|nr:membrane protein insertion efficiency factor YidD [Candidatus Omnitrophota bacterium]